MTNGLVYPVHPIDPVHPCSKGFVPIIGAMTQTTPPPTALAWIAFALLSLALFGNYYVYDAVGPVADLLQKQMGFSDAQIGLLNAVYSLPNIVLVLGGGILVDRFGAGVAIFGLAVVCLIGAVLTAVAPD